MVGVSEDAGQDCNGMAFSLAGLSGSAGEFHFEDGVADGGAGGAVMACELGFTFERDRAVGGFRGDAGDEVAAAEGANIECWVVGGDPFGGT